MHNYPNFLKVASQIIYLVRMVLVSAIILVGIACAFNFLNEPSSGWSILYCLVAMVVFLPSIDYWSRVIKDWLGG